MGIFDRSSGGRRIRVLEILGIPRRAYDRIYRVSDWPRLLVVQLVDFDGDEISFLRSIFCVVCGLRSMRLTSASVERARVCRCFPKSFRWVPSSRFEI